jgi:phytoene dehydrogenase-like protein
VHRYNSIIIGAGHNGLVCANYLARKGQKVLLLEASDSVGGLASVREFHPEFKTSVAHSVGYFSEKVARDLNLKAHGFNVDADLSPTIGLSTDASHVVLQGERISGVETDDEQSYGNYVRLMRRFADMVKPFWLETVPPIGNNSLPEIMSYAHLGMNMRLMGKADMREFLRILTLPMRDLMDENFDNELLKAMLSWDGLIGSKLAPRSPNHSLITLLLRMSGKAAHQVSSAGVKTLIEALHSSASASGVEIRTGVPVGEIVIGDDAEGLIAMGVKLDSGEQIEADRVISSADPKKTFFDLVGVEHLEIGFCNRIRRLRGDGYVAKLHLALKGLPEFTGLDNPDGRLMIAPDMDVIEFAYDDAKYGHCSKVPVMEIVIPSIHDETLAPAGQHVLSAHVMYVPRHLQGGWDDQAHEAYCQLLIDTLAQYAPGIREQILHHELLTPADLEREYGVTGGHWHHAELSLDQSLMMRPTYGAAQYQTPIGGLHLCGAGCHPGGGLMGGAGHNAAQEILK